MITGGGTGGHVFPGLAVARELLRRDPVRPIVWIGSRAGLESRLVPAEGIRLVSLSLGGLAGKGIVTRLRSAAQALAGVLRCMARFLRDRPAAVLGVGGFASGPACLAAVLLRVPLILHEQNSVPGGTNRFLARFARAIAVSFDETAAALEASRIIVTGNPVRAEFFAPAAPVAQRAETAQPPRLKLLVVGGSRGARSINRAVAGALPGLARWKGRLSIVHQTGEADWEEARKAHAGAGLDSEVLPFLDDMPRRMREADLVLSRSGASAVFEIAAAGRPAILVPFPHAAGGHQAANARSLAAAGAALVIEDRELSGGRLAAALDALLPDSQRLRTMADAARRLSRPDAASRIADLVEEAGAGAVATAGREGA